MLQRLRGDGGANAVEFALVLPVLVLLLFGTMYGASMFNTYQTLNQASREAARFGATLPLVAYGNASQPTATWFAEVEARASDILAGDRPLTSPSGGPVICVVFHDGVGGRFRSDPTCTMDAPGSTADPQGARVEVEIVQDARLELGVAPSPTVPLRAFAVGRYESGLD